MKRYKNVFILLGVLAVLCVITLVVTKVEEKKEQIKNTDEIILAVEADSITSLSWEYSDTKLSFHKDGNWYWDEDSNFPVNETKINKLLSIFEDFGAAFIIENVDNFSQYGLDNPTCTIKFSTEDKDYEVVLGAFSTMDSERYVSIGDGNVYLVKKDPLDTFGIELSDTILNDEIPSFDTVTEVHFSGAETYNIKYEEGSTNTYCDEDVYFTEVNSKTVPLDTSLVKNYCSNVSILNLSEYASYNVTDEELASYGLTNPDEVITVYYTVKDDNDNEHTESFTLNLGRDTEAVKEKEEKEAAGEKYSGTIACYARVSNSQIVYQISSSNYDTLMANSYDCLRHKDVFTADFGKATQIDLTLDGSSYSITSAIPEDSEDSARVYYYGEDELDISDIKSKVNALSVSSFIDETATEKEELSMVFTLTDANVSKVTVNIYRYDGSDCLVVLNGETIGLVTRTSVVDLIEAINTIVLG